MDGLKANSNGMEYKPKANISQIDERSWSQEKSKSQIGRLKFLSVSHPSIYPPLCQY